MNIRKELEAEHSKKKTLEITHFVSNNEAHFSLLMDCFFDGPYHITQRASWPIQYCFKNYKELIDPYIGEMLDFCKQDVHDAVKRSTMLILSEMNIPEYLLGKAATIAFDLLLSNREPVAIKVHSMQTLYNINVKEPALKKELKLIIEEQLPYSTAGFKSRAAKILKQLENIN